MSLTFDGLSTPEKRKEFRDAIPSTLGGAETYLTEIRHAVDNSRIKDRAEVARQLGLSESAYTANVSPSRLKTDLVTALLAEFEESYVGDAPVGQAVPVATTEAEVNSRWKREYEFKEFQRMEREESGVAAEEDAPDQLVAKGEEYTEGMFHALSVYFKHKQSQIKQELYRSEPSRDRAMGGYRAAGQHRARVAREGNYAPTEEENAITCKHVAKDIDALRHHGRDGVASALDLSTTLTQVAFSFPDAVCPPVDALAFLGNVSSSMFGNNVADFLRLMAGTQDHGPLATDSGLRSALVEFVSKEWASFADVGVQPCVCEKRREMFKKEAELVAAEIAQILEDDDVAGKISLDDDGVKAAYVAYVYSAYYLVAAIMKKRRPIGLTKALRMKFVTRILMHAPRFPTAATVIAGATPGAPRAASYDATAKTKKRAPKASEQGGAASKLRHAPMSQHEAQSFAARYSDVSVVAPELSLKPGEADQLRAAYGTAFRAGPQFEPAAAKANRPKAFTKQRAKAFLVQWQQWCEEQGVSPYTGCE